MHITSINAKNFRNLENIDIKLSPDLTILTGQNAQGKTNTLEAILLSLNGRSHRESITKNFIGPKADYSHINVSVNYADGSACSVALKIDTDKHFSIDGESVSRRSLIKNFSVILFSPEDLKIVKEGPEKRRAFLNEALYLISYQYAVLQSTYIKTLKQRNSLLKEYGPSSESLLEVYDESLADTGSMIARYRIKFLRGYEEHLNDFYKKVSSQKEKISIRYISNVVSSVKDANKEEYLNKLRLSRRQDIISRSTQAGVHHDDISIFIDGKDARKFASQGQQRSIAVSMKLALSKMLEANGRDLPIILLDDVMSELDSSRQKGILDALRGIQTVITAVDDSFAACHENIICYIVENGKLTLKTEIS